MSSTRNIKRMKWDTRRILECELTVDDATLANLERMVRQNFGSHLTIVSTVGASTAHPFLRPVSLVPLESRCHTPTQTT
jgi:hypothetical protein